MKLTILLRLCVVNRVKAMIYFICKFILFLSLNLKYYIILKGVAITSIFILPDQEVMHVFVTSMLENCVGLPLPLLCISKHRVLSHRFMGEINKSNADTKLVQVQLKWVKTWDALHS